MEENSLNTDLTNVVGYFSSKRQATIVHAVLARTNDMGGKECYSVTSHTPPAIKPTDKPTTYYHLRFFPDVWEKKHHALARKGGYETFRTAPTIREISMFVRGYLRALTGVKPTVL